MKKNIKFDSIEILTKTPTGLLVLNTGITEFLQSDFDGIKALRVAAEVSHKNGFTTRFLLNLAFDALKLIR